MSECKNISECNENVFIFNALVRKMEKRLFKIFLFSLIGLFLISNASAIYIGITDGYVKDNLGNLVSGASVTVTVTGCSGDGCSGTGTSEANGYYVVANLNLPKYGGVSVTATKAGGSGSATGTADNYQVAHVNVSVCSPPTSASLTPVADSENPAIIFTWTSGTDPNLLTTYDDFRLDGSVTSPATSPQARTVSFTSHTWDARTCNNYCCSGWASDSFTISCTPPSVPVQTHVPDSHSTSANFVWTSGTDPLLRPTYDEFQFDSEAVISPASSPISRAGLSYATHTWKTRTCNAYCCSGWASDSFTVGNQPPSVPTGTNATPHNATTDLIWVSGIDPELDPTYDEFQLSGSPVVSPATSPQTVVSQILLKWQVRTCDNLGACSAWVSVESVTCSEISQFCPAAKEIERIIYRSEGGGGCPESLRPKTQVYCNGIAYENISMLRLDMITGKTIAQISIQGKNISLKNLEYCPWCYDGKKNFDETGVDCGGSCRDCAQIEIPARISVWLVAAAGILIAGAIGYWIYRAMKKKSLLKTKKPVSR
jgi:hypothetical protein